MLDMSKLPSHKIENGIVIFDEPFSVNLFEFVGSILDCDCIVYKDDNSLTNKRVYAFASSEEYNSDLCNFFHELPKDKYILTGHLSSKPPVRLYPLM